MALSESERLKGERKEEEEKEERSKGERKEEEEKEERSKGSEALAETEKITNAQALVVNRTQTFFFVFFLSFFFFFFFAMNESISISVFRNVLKKLQP